MVLVRVRVRLGLGLMLLDSWILENFMNHIASFLRNLVDHIALSESGPIILDS